MISDLSTSLGTPLTTSDIRKLRAGNLVTISGIIYAARDAAHQRMVHAEALPFDPDGHVIYYVGPTPARPGRVIGAAGPTTASRMDPYAPFLIERGLRGMIGKGRRSAEVCAAMQKYGCVYFGAVEGTAALLGRCVTSAKVIAYEDLQAEAVWQFTVDDFPAVVVNDVYGGDLYEEGQKQYRRQSSTDSF